MNDNKHASNVFELNMSDNLEEVVEEEDGRKIVRVFGSDGVLQYTDIWDEYGNVTTVFETYENSEADLNSEEYNKISLEIETQAMVDLDI